MQLIVVEKFDNEETKTIVTEWSIEHGVEIIDFSEDSEEGNDQVTVFAGTYINRVLSIVLGIKSFKFSTQLNKCRFLNRFFTKNKRKKEKCKN